jgi:hypothetical protein
VVPQVLLHANFVCPTFSTNQDLKKLGTVMPDPREVMGVLMQNPEAWPDHRDAARVGSYLRETEEHMTLLEMFTRLVVTSKIFKEKATVYPLRKYMPPTMEAFLILSYVNSYGFWMKLFEASPAFAEQAAGGIEGDELSTYSGQRLFTSDSKGKGKYNGWSPEGMTLHRRISGIIKAQREDTAALGVEFEQELMRRFSAKPGVVDQEAGVGVVVADDMDEYFANQAGQDNMLAGQAGHRVYAI